MNKVNSSSSHSAEPSLHLSDIPCGLKPQLLMPMAENFKANKFCPQVKSS